VLSHIRGKSNWLGENLLAVLNFIIHNCKLQLATNYHMLSFIIPLLLCFISTVNSEGIADIAAGSPSSSPIERSNRTIYNDGALHIINSESTSFDHETIIVTDGSTLHLKEDGYIIGMYISCVLYVILLCAYHM